MREWTLDWNAAFVVPCMDCAYLTPTLYRAYKDGDFYDNLPTLLVENRSSDYPYNRTDSRGFRCARTP